MSKGTLVADFSSNAEADAEALYKAMKGLGTDENVITSILGHRTLKQRKEIADTFQTMYGKTLKDWLTSELSGDYEKVILGLLKDPLTYEAESVYKAIKGAGTNEKVLVQIIATKGNKEIEALSEAYQKLYNKSLKEDVEGDTSGDLKRILVSILTANRGLGADENDVDKGMAGEDAQQLYEAGEAKWGTDECVFTRILCTRTKNQLKEMFKSYNLLSGKSLYDVLDSEFSGYARDALQAICLSSANKSRYYAQELYKAMKGMGTDDEALIRIIVTRCERDLLKIKNKFAEVYNEDLGKWVKGEASGDYEKILLALIGDA